MLGVWSIVLADIQTSDHLDEKIQSLKIGEQCPDFEFTNIINWDKESAKLSDLKGKLVILDFWGTWCVPCISAMPKLDSLQKIYSNEIVILPITDQSITTVKKFVNFHSDIKGLTLPYVTENTNLRKYFPYTMIPHVVWISGKGEVLAITGTDELNRYNIDNYIQYGSLNLNMKDDIAGFDFRKNLLLDGIPNYTWNTNDVKYSSVLTNHIKGLPAMSSTPEVYNNKAKIICTNVTISVLYQTAFIANSIENEFGHVHPDSYLRFPSRVVWEAKDSTLFNWIGRSREDFLSVPDSLMYYCYELIYPKENFHELNKYMLEDLNRFFGNKLGIKGTIEKRIVQYYALQQTSNLSFKDLKSGRRTVYINSDAQRIEIKNATLDDFVFNWVFYNLYKYPIPIVNHVNYPGLIELNLNANPKDFNDVNYALKEYGVEFKLVEEELEMIVIKDL